MDYLDLKRQMLSVSVFCFAASKGTVFQFVCLKNEPTAGSCAGSCALLFYTSMFHGKVVRYFLFIYKNLIFQINLGSLGTSLSQGSALLYR